ncbi:MAG: FAD-dependent oxidoreductase [Chloroflexota bacterium]|nr:FAD-dependent oxidoreductase [Chloroflexota bacterium]
MHHKDVLIVGGGPAGAACAWQLRRHGLDPLILDKAAFPRQKTCAGWVTPALFQLLEITPEDYPFGLTKFTSFQISVKGIKFRLPTRQYAIRRWEFDHWLLQYSGSAFESHHVKEVTLSGDQYIVDGQYSSKVIVGAGGTHCPIRKAFFSLTRPGKAQTLILAKEEEFLYHAHDQRCHLWFFEDGLPGYAWYVPKATGFLNVGIGGSAAGLKTKGATLNHHWEMLVNKLAELGLVSGHQFHPSGYSYRLRHKGSPKQEGRAYLVGDSIGLATIDMGEGIVPAIQSGILAANAIASGSDYDINSIPRFSLPSLLRLRK